MMDQEQPVREPSPQEPKRRNRWLIVALIAAVGAGILLASSVWTNRWTGESESGNEVAETRVPDLRQWCAAQSTYDLIRRELFRRAAQVRGSDQQAYARLADFALLRVSGPVVREIDEDLQSVTCSGNAVLDLPPGVSVAGGRRSLSSDLDYIVQAAADGTGNVVRLGSADGIVVPLATLARVPGAQVAPATPSDVGNAIEEEPLPATDEDVEAEEPAAPIQANPSFDCDDARTRGEIAVCRDPGLAALDRQMAGQFEQAMMQADRRQRSLLERTRGRFLSYRDRCATNQCIADTYRSRMREIGDIMANRWRG
jgi:uncharacterized protein YecT (DUF1311 family)